MEEKGGVLLRFTDQLNEVHRATKEVKLHVLLDRKIHISFEGNHTHRVFGNIWEYNQRTYLKGASAISFFITANILLYIQLQDIRGYLLEAEELRDELQTHEGPEVKMVTSSGSRISYKWEDVLKEAKSAKKNVVFRPAATVRSPLCCHGDSAKLSSYNVKKTERVDSGYLSAPASPASPALSYKPSELSPPEQLGRDPGPRMPSPSHLSSDQSSFPPKLHPMSMPIPDPTLQTDLSGPTRLLPPPILVSSSSTTSYHSAYEENEGLEFRSHHFKDQNPRSGGSVRPSQPVHEIQSCPSSTPQHVIVSQVGFRIERPLSATVTPGSQFAFEMPQPTTAASDAHVKSGLGKESDLSAHVPKPSSIPNDVSVSSRDAPKAIHDTSAESRRRTESRALDTNHAATSVNNSINGTPGKGARINRTSGSPQSSVPSQLTNRIRDDAVRRQGLVPEGERHHAQDPGRRSYRPGQDEGEAAPAFPSFPPTNVHTREPATNREEQDTKYGQAMPAATNEASSSTHFQHDGQSVPRRPVTGTPAGRQSYISHPVPNNSTGPARNEFRELGQSTMAVDASISPSGASFRNFTPTQPESVSDAGYRNLKTPAAVAPHQPGSTRTVDMKMEGNGKNAVSDHLLSQKGMNITFWFAIIDDEYDAVVPAPLGNRLLTTPPQLQPQSNSAKKKGWFTRVVEKVKSVWD